RYYATNTPVVLTQAISEWPALQKWTPEYLRERYGDVQIEIVEGRDGNPYCDRQYERVKRSTTMRRYAQRVLDAGKTNDFYFIARNKNVELSGLSSLREDIRPLPPFIHPDRD